MAQVQCTCAGMSCIIEGDRLSAGLPKRDSLFTARCCLHRSPTCCAFITENSCSKMRGARPACRNTTNPLLIWAPVLPTSVNDGCRQQADTSAFGTSLWAPGLSVRRLHRSLLPAWCVSCLKCTSGTIVRAAGAFSELSGYSAGTSALCATKTVIVGMLPTDHLKMLRRTPSRRN